MLSLVTATEIAASVGVLVVLLAAYHGQGPKLTKAMPGILLTIQLANPVSYIQRRLKAWSFLFNGPQIIREGYEQSGGKPFEVFDPDTRYVFVSSTELVKQVSNAGDGVLSLHAASKQMIQPKYTMHGFNWHDQRSVSGVGYSRALRTMLTNHMPSVLPQLQVTIAENFTQHIERDGMVNGSSAVPLYPMILETSSLVNSTAFFGKELAANKEFMNAALHLIEDTLVMAESVRLLPKLISRPVAYFLSKRLTSPSVLYDALVPVVKQRMREREMKAAGQEVPEHHDCIQWMLDSSTKKDPWDEHKIIGHLMAIWFGSVHALSTVATFAIYDLLLHPEYIDPLRKEIESVAYQQFVGTAQGLPLMDSFFKESARVTAGETMSTRRRAIQPLTLADGTIINAGDWVCTPVQELNNAEDFVPNPHEFRGFRFADQEAMDRLQGSKELNDPTDQTLPSKFTDIHDWHAFGTGRLACPGRFYASTVMKMMLSDILTKYDCEMVDKEAPRWFSWRSSLIPRKTTLVRFTERAK